MCSILGPDPKVQPHMAELGHKAIESFQKLCIVNLLVLGVGILRCEKKTVIRLSSNLIPKILRIWANQIIVIEKIQLSLSSGKMNSIY